MYLYPNNACIYPNNACIYTLTTRVFTLATRVFTLTTRVYSNSACIYSNNACIYPNNACIYPSNACCRFRWWRLAATARATSCLRCCWLETTMSPKSRFSSAKFCCAVTARSSRVWGPCAHSIHPTAGHWLLWACALTVCTLLRCSIHTLLYRGAL
jgi:hypothetical protein